MHVLIAEDDQALSEFLARGLSALSDTVEVAHDGEKALSCFSSNEPDLLLLDLDLPGRCGAEVLSVVRDWSPLCPVLILSARVDHALRIACLEAGADDCMSKPFSLAELRARCGAMLRRRLAVQACLLEKGAPGTHEGPSALECGALRLQRVRRQVTVAEEPVHLTNREFALLEQLLLACGSALSRRALREAVWEAKEIETNALDVHIAALRRKLINFEGAPAIETVRGAGYRLVAAAAQEAGSYAGARYARA